MLRSILFIFVLISVVVSSHEVEDAERGHRKLAADSQPINPVKSQQLMRDIIHPPGKNEKLRTLLAFIKSFLPLDIRMTFHEQSKQPNPQAAEALISAAFDTNFIIKDALHFVGTARRAGFRGDIVVPILPNSKPEFIDKLIQYNASIYTVYSQCSMQPDTRCTFMQTELPISFFRALAYLNAVMTYSEHTKIMLSDFRDVFFQSDPFQTKALQSLKSPSQLLVFTEAYPNRMIGRCPLTSGRLIDCYGKDVTQDLSGSVISTSLNVFCMQPACLAYLFLLISQADVDIRRVYGNATASAASAAPWGALPFRGATGQTDSCLRFAADMAFHNVLLYNNVFSKYLTVKVYGQGEGPFNSLGGFFGEKKLLKAPLTDWRILRGGSPHMYIYNWGGKISPVVHQLDRFLGTEIQPPFSDHLAVFSDLIYSDALLGNKK